MQLCDASAQQKDHCRRESTGICLQAVLHLPGVCQVTSAQDLHAAGCVSSVQAQAHFNNTVCCQIKACNPACTNMTAAPLAQHHVLAGGRHLQQKPNATATGVVLPKVPAKTAPVPGSTALKPAAKPGPKLSPPVRSKVAAKPPAAQVAATPAPKVAAATPAPKVSATPAPKVAAATPAPKVSATPAPKVAAAAVAAAASRPAAAAVDTSLPVDPTLMVRDAPQGRGAEDRGGKEHESGQRDGGHPAGH
jgi:hypothetical protein